MGRNRLPEVRRLVIKFGTRVLRGRGGRVDRRALRARLAELVEARNEGRRVVLVSSGAIALGWKELGYRRRPTAMPELQAAAAVGQSRLMRTMNEILAPKRIVAAQLLLTHEDFRDRQRYLNLRNTIAALHEAGAIPVINENDTVSVEEIRFGDNDILAALVAGAVDADLTVLYSDVRGLYDGRRRLDVVEGTDETLDKLIQKGAGPEGSGGMESKLRAVRMIAAYGSAAILAHGKQDSLPSLLGGDAKGTLFLPREARMASRKRWIAFSARGNGALRIDSGAADAILRRGKSLLPAGITECEGDFRAGDAVRILNGEGRVIAKGLSNFAAADVRRVLGRNTREIERALGHRYFEEVIHRNNMVILEGRSA